MTGNYPDVDLGGVMQGLGLTVDQEIRNEFNTLHGRVNELRDRVVKLEAQVPHTNDMLQRIEKSVEKINSHFVKAIWLVFVLVVGVVFNFAIRGGFHVE